MCNEILKPGSLNDLKKKKTDSINRWMINFYCALPRTVAYAFLDKFTAVSVPFYTIYNKKKNDNSAVISISGVHKPNSICHVRILPVIESPYSYFPVKETKKEKKKLFVRTVPFFGHSVTFRFRQVRKNCRQRQHSRLFIHRQLNLIDRCKREHGGWKKNNQQICINILITYLFIYY